MRSREPPAAPLETRDPTHNRADRWVGLPIVKEIRVKESVKEAGFREPRKDRLLRELVHDPYQSKSKLPDPTVCPHCGAVYHEGRWTWMARPAQAHAALCPACRRIRDAYPAGFLTVRGPFLQAHKQEILNKVCLRSS